MLYTETTFNNISDSSYKDRFCKLFMLFEEVYSFHKVFNHMCKMINNEIIQITNKAKAQDRWYSGYAYDIKNDCTIKTSIPQLKEYQHPIYFEYFYDKTHKCYACADVSERIDEYLLKSNSDMTVYVNLAYINSSNVRMLSSIAVEELSHKRDSYLKKLKKSDLAYSQLTIDLFKKNNINISDEDFVLCSDILYVLSDTEFSGHVEVCLEFFENLTDDEIKEMIKMTEPNYVNWTYTITFLNYVLNKYKNSLFIDSMKKSIKTIKEITKSVADNNKITIEASKTLSVLAYVIISNGNYDPKDFTGESEILMINKFNKMDIPKSVYNNDYILTKDEYKFIITSLIQKTFITKYNEYIHTLKCAANIFIDSQRYKQIKKDIIRADSKTGIITYESIRTRVMNLYDEQRHMYDSNQSLFVQIYEFLNMNDVFITNISNKHIFDTQFDSKYKVEHINFLLETHMEWIVDMMSVESKRMFEFKENVNASSISELYFYREPDDCDDIFEQETLEEIIDTDYIDSLV